MFRSRIGHAPAAKFGPIAPEGRSIPFLGAFSRHENGLHERSEIENPRSSKPELPHTPFFGSFRGMSEAGPRPLRRMKIPRPNPFFEPPKSLGKSKNLGNRTRGRPKFSNGLTGIHKVARRSRAQSNIANMTATFSAISRRFPFWPSIKQLKKRAARATCSRPSLSIVTRGLTNLRHLREPGSFTWKLEIERRTI